jgi:hypothetical protein
LGGKTYNIIFNLDGDNSNVPQLKDVTVKANMYFSGRRQTSDGSSKLTELDLDMDIYGSIVKINVVVDNQIGNRCFYLNIAQVLNIKLPDLKVSATEDDIYNTLEQIVKLVTDTNAVKFLANTFGSASASLSLDDIDFNSVTDVTEEQTSAIVNVITTLLSFDVSKAFSATKVDNRTVATVDLDNLVAQLGFDINYNLGLVTAEIDHSTHSIKTSGKNLIDGENKEWLSLASELTDLKSYSDFDRDKYISISFLSTLIADITKFATDENGDIYEMFTFRGTITATIIGGINIKINISTLTLSYNEKGEMYFSLVGNLSGDMVSSNTIGITYQNGYITLGKNLDSTPIYRIMTMAYFVDHMFDTNTTSPLQWLLGVNSFLWATTAYSLKNNLDISSGIENPQDVYLYNQNTQSEDRVVSMYDFVNCVNVMLNGEQVTTFGDYTNLVNNLGVSDNYYGFDLNAGVITDNVLTSLYGALMRNDDNGITGIKAYGAIQT